MELTDDVRQILNVQLPGNVPGSGLPRTTATALVVEHQAISLGQPQELWEEIVVVCTGSAMQHQRFRSVLGPISTPEKWDPGGGRITRRGWWWDRTRHLWEM